jgi:hypothetical protein
MEEMMAKKTAKKDDEKAKHKANTSTTAEGEDDLADVDPGELDHAANAGAQTKKAPKAKTRKENSPHIPAEDFRAAVANQPAGDLNMDPREPYPTGNPPDHRETFHRIHGHYPDEAGDPADAQAAQMDADPKT